jgi:hypothetical protein
MSATPCTRPVTSWSAFSSVSEWNIWNFMPDCFSAVVSSMSKAGKRSL